MAALHVDPSIEFRGGQRQLEYLLRERPGDAWAGVPSAPLAARARPPAVPLRHGNVPANAWALASFLRAVPGRFGLVAAHTSHALDAALAASLVHGPGFPPIVAHRRVDFALRWPWTYRRADAVIAVSHAVAAVLARQGVPVARVIYDGAEDPPPGPSLREIAPDLPRPVYLCAGALVPHKGHRVAVEALRSIPGGLVLAGAGGEERDLRARADGRVCFAGTVEGLGTLLREVDALVHPSLEEGLGQVVIEAMRVGCPVVATRAGGLPEVLDGHAVLVAPGDPADLARGMREVLGRPRGEAIDRARELSVARMVAATGEVYEGVAATRRRAR